MPPSVLAAFTAPVLWATTVFGGVGQNPQVQALAGGIDVLVACPGRLEDLIGQGHADLSAVEITVLDEADHMADLGFLPAVRRLLDRTPKGGQRLLFSATLDNGVDVLVHRVDHTPVGEGGRVVQVAGHDQFPRPAGTGAHRPHGTLLRAPWCRRLPDRATPRRSR